MITTHPEDTFSKTYAEQVLRGLDALEAKLKGHNNRPLWTAIDAAFVISADKYSLAWIASRQELVVLMPDDGITPGVHCPHINCEELIVLVNTRTYMGIGAPVLPRKGSEPRYYRENKSQTWRHCANTGCTSSSARTPSSIWLTP